MDLGFVSVGTKQVDVVVIGGGPAGATAALYTARSGLSTLVLDKGVTAGALGMTTKIANYPGVPGNVRGDELVTLIRDQAASFGAEFVTDKVLHVALQGDSKQVWGGNGQVQARAVIIATGSMGRTNHPQVTIYPSTRIHEIVGEEKVEAVRAVSQPEDEQAIPVRGVFIYLLGNVPIIDFLDHQLPTREDGCLLVDEDFQTTIPGVFAAGDVLCKHLKQAVIAAAEGAQAATAADRYLRGRKKLRPDWSQ